jgi:hypothetical protein
MEETREVLHSNFVPRRELCPACFDEGRVLSGNGGFGLLEVKSRYVIENSCMKRT